MVRASVIAQWRRLLSASRERLDTKPSPLTWPHQVYVKVLSFLLARYGKEGTADADEPLVDPPAASAAGLQTPEPLEGRPPKSSEHIRATLSHLHEARGAAPQGPLVAVAPEQRWVTVQAFEKRRHEPSPRSLALQLQRRLALQGIRSERLRLHRAVVVQVARADYDRAREIVASPLPARRFDAASVARTMALGYAFVAAIILLLAGIGAVFGWPRAVVLLLATVLCSAVVLAIDYVLVLRKLKSQERKGS